MTATRVFAAPLDREESSPLDTVLRLRTVSRSLMPRLLRLFSLLLLVLWISGTQHCDLVGAGILPSCDTGLPERPCGIGTCAEEQHGAYRPSERADAIGAPAVRTLDPFLLSFITLVHVERDDEHLRRAPLARPLDWVSTWHFVRRTAPPSRAPTVLLS
ncbi:hypothetical protein DB347_20160 [Opitutaceae bacterium EW11]|nr:hypothetical protein DB347_20160 [Opitutaceae bacterium EW11]